MFRSWLNILRENTRESCEDLGLTWAWRHPMIPILLFFIYIAIVWFLIGETEATTEIEIKLAAIAAPLAVLPVWWMFRLFRTIPQREARSERRIALLHTYLRPRLTVELLNEGRAISFPYGTKTKTGDGDVVTNIRGHDRLICAVVRNTSGKQAQFVEARFSEVVGDNGNRMRDPVPIFWGPKGYQGGSAVVPANGERTLLLFRVGHDGIYFSDPDAPLEYQTFFAGGATFTGRFVLEEIYHCSLEVHFVLDLGAEPALRIVRTDVVTHRTDDEYERQLALMEPHHI